jgi:hypothetical protein
MRDWLARLGRVVGVGGVQAVPVGGVFAAGWSPGTAIALYWCESALMVVASVVLVALLRHTTERAPADTPDAAEWRWRRLADIDRANIRTRDVLAFYGGSILVIGAFLGAVTLIVTQNTGQPAFDAVELRRGLLVMTGFVGIGLAADAVRITSLPVSTVQSRVDANFGRWAFFWILGFVGLGASMLLGTPATFFSFFVGLKAFWELGRLFDRAVAAASPAGAPERVTSHTHVTDVLLPAADAPPAPPPPVSARHRVERTR